MDDTCLFLDVTTVITLVSDSSCRPHRFVDKFTNYVNNIEDRYYYNKIKSITSEIQDEIKNPVYPKLVDLMKGKRLFMVKEANDRIMKEMRMIMNIDEAKRYDELMKTITLVESDVSTRFHLWNSRQTTR